MKLKVQDKVVQLAAGKNVLGERLSWGSRETLKWRKYSATHLVLVQWVPWSNAEVSAENVEHAQWKRGNLEFEKIVGLQLIKQWHSFLSSANNKTERIRFIVAVWKKNACLFSNKLIYVIREQECFFIFEGNCSAANHSILTQEEVDTLLLLHAHEASLNC